MKLIKASLILVICMAWIFITNNKTKPLNSIGELLTYKTGLLSVPLQENGILQLKGDYHPKIYVDSIGIPHVYGKTQKDLAFGLGYMHAKDRYFQMEMITRTVQGRMSEILSESTLNSDNFWKPYEFERKSEELLIDYKEKSPEFHKYLQAYAEGVNTYLKNNQNTDPLYKAIGETPQVWKPEYSLLATWYMSYTLSYFDNHVKQQEIITELSEDVKNYFYPSQPKGLQTILPSSYKENEEKQEQGKLQEAVVYENVKNDFENPFQFHPSVGSNNWAVNKFKTKDNATILANDPHLFLTLPEAFYETHLISEKSNIYGFSIPGVPAIVSGHNDKISWGITNGEWDLIDRYQLKVKNDSLYYYENNWIPFDQKDYVIKIKGEKDHVVTQKTTVHGKVIEENGQYYAQHWYASNKSYSIEAIYKIMQSENWTGFKEALKDYGYPPQNFIYSDIDDNIGIVCAGKLPERSGNYQGGLLDGTITYHPIKNMDTLWYDYNPDRKFLFSANQQPVQNDVYFGQHGIKDDYRVQRIYSLLENNNDWELEEIKRMQSDEVDLSFNDFKTLLDKYKIENDHNKVVDALKYWNGDMKGDNLGALVYETIRRLTEMEAENFAKRQLKINKAPSFKYYLKYLKDDDYLLPGSPSKQELFANIIQKTDSMLNKHFGEKWENTQYKEVSQFTINNILFIPGLGEKIDDAGGNANTINLNTGDIHPVYRAVYHMKKDAIKAYTILAGGQSGNINSDHYKDQLGSWKSGKYKETQFESDPNRLKNIENIISFK
jgi:penicillin amidase